MKNLLLVLLMIPLMFDSCKKDDDDNVVPVVPSSSNTWTKTFGGTEGDGGRSVQQTTDGGYIITGDTRSFGNGESDVYLIKTDGNGLEQWNKTFGGTSCDGGRSVQQTTDGGYIITGDICSSGNCCTGGADMDICLIKIDGNGVEQWKKTFGGTNDEWGNSVQQTTDGGYIITGFKGFSGSGGDVYLIKTDENGDSLWSNTFGAGNGNCVQQTTDGGYIIIGSNSFIKTDVNGTEQWSNSSIGGGGSVQQTTDGGYIVTGNTNNLIKTDGTGTEQWNKTIQTLDIFQSYVYAPHSVQQTTDGGYIISSTLFMDSVQGMPPYNSYAYLIKRDGNGNEQWTKTFGGTEYEDGRSVQQTTDGGYIITGDTRSFGNGESDVYLIKTDENGNVNP